ncbi:patatin-like phospholipase domain-containing protein 4 [Etheostoma cragini]|uniref:patatin-like phospholipase domain-containing protein 4 n=1 Tax=Etheostoma cragini TaxID=417921 RepID=UPI00155F2414|nr:patatin-like phospholipase domain-containing protein 4 [Etheostoma cragini]XP_034720850.1 patatin-like phospholipase domain-containing protein 4 [Etheostoma cragini]XP_034720851.1 patatin-like phospholipase domain-containing protein 4 [Etheostoma cragini]
MTVLNLSFAACGFLGIYQLGAVGAFLRHGDRLLGSLGACAGASAGALVAAVMITAPNKLENCKEFTYRFADSVRRQPFGGATPGYDFLLTLREGIEEILPSEAHRLAAGRLHVSVTNSRSGHNQILSRFSSREELIQALLASSFVPFYAGLHPVELRGQKWMDGGFSDSLPILPLGRTITVSPFAGLQDVCPVHRGRSNTQLKLANMNIMLSVENLKRLNRALFPPSSAGMQALCEEGFKDAVGFLKREDWMSS